MTRSSRGNPRVQIGASTFSALHAVAVAAGGFSGERQLADLVVDRARAVAGGDAAVLRWFEPATGSFQLLASLGAQAEPEPDIAADAPTAIREAFETGKPVLINDYEASGKATAWGRLHKIRAQVAVPLLVDGRPVGTLGVLSFSEDRFRESDARVLSLMAAMVAPALQAARLTEQVKRQDEMIRQTYEALPVAVLVFDRSGQAIYNNQVAETILGSGMVAGIRAGTLDLYDEQGVVLSAEHRPTSRALQTKAPIRNAVVGVGAHPGRWFLLDAVPILDQAGDVESLVTSAIEITSLKAAEERQRLDAERLRLMIHVQSVLGDAELGAARIMEIVASQAVELTGAAGAAVQMLDGAEVAVTAAAGFGSGLLGMRFPTKGNPITGCIEEGTPQSTQDALVDPRCDQRAARITGIRSLIMAPIRWEGHVLGGVQLQSPEPNAFGEADQVTLELLAGFAGAAIARARSAEALRASEQQFSGAFEASGIGMALTALDGVVVRANPALCRMLGYTEAELSGMDTRTIVVAEDLESVVETLAGLYLHAEPAVQTIDARVHHRDGRAIWTRLTASLVRVDDRPQQVLLHLVDVTEERKAESILKSEQDRLAVIIEAQRDIASNEPDLERLLGVLAERTIQLTGAGAAAVLLPKDDLLVVRAAAGTPEIPMGASLPVAGSLAGLAFTTRSAQRVSDAKTDSRAHGATARAAGLGAMVATPLVSGDKVMGVLQLVSQEAGALDEIDARTLEMVGGFAAAAFERATTTRRLKAGEQRVRAVIDTAPDPIVTFDADGRIVDFNPAAERAFLQRREEIIGQSGATLLAGKHADAFARWLRDGAQAGSAEYAGRHFETTGLRGDGTEFPMEIAIANLPEETRLAAAFVRDLTMRDRLKESRDRVAAIVETAPVILIACDTNGVVTLAQGKGLAKFDLTPETTVGHNVREWMKPYHDASAMVDRAIKGEIVTGQAHLTQSDRYLDVYLSPNRASDGTLTGFSGVLADVTDRVRVEAAVRDSETKSRLMAMMNHEVRTPLNSILGFAHMLADPRTGELTDKQRRYVANIDMAGNHLLALVNDSLEMAKLDAGRAGIQPADFSAESVMVQAADQVRPLADNNGLTLVVGSAPEVMVRADPRQVVQVLLNLLANAVRHTPAGGTVTLAARAAGGEVAISVADTGVGIARDELGRIFQEFFQAGNHAPGGIGLGLAISRRLVQMMGGSISVESELGHGSTFSVRLPSAGDAQARDSK